MASELILESPPYFYFRFRQYGYRDGCFCLIFARTAQQSVLDGTNRLSSSKPWSRYGTLRDVTETLRKRYGALRDVMERYGSVVEAFQYVAEGYYGSLQDVTRRFGTLRKRCGSLWNVTGPLQNVTERCGTAIEYI